MQTTKAYMDGAEERALLEMLADMWARPRQKMIALIDLANEKKMKKLKKEAPLRRIEEEKARLQRIEQEESKEPIG